jgi:hypothetical protein
LTARRLARALPRLHPGRRRDKPLVHHEPRRRDGRGEGFLLEKRAQYYEKRADAGPAEELAREVMDGRVRVQDIAAMFLIRCWPMSTQRSRRRRAER